MNKERKQKIIIQLNNVSQGNGKIMSDCKVFKSPASTQRQTKVIIYNNESFQPGIRTEWKSFAVQVL